MIKRITPCHISWAEPPAHILLHASGLSPILRARQSLQSEHLSPRL
ncbi:protein YnhH [Klebsiella pneumoniae]